MDRKAHWEHVYSTRSADTVSWFQPRAVRSLRLIAAAGVPRDAAIIDVGGGASLLVDDLLSAGHTDLTVLDLSATALAAARARLGPKASAVHWIEGDVTHADLPVDSVDLWHDRAAFHFLVDDADRAAYLATLRRALRPGGHVVIATFAEDGPERCSGLTVRRYSAPRLHEAFGQDLTLLSEEREEHVTPGGAVQRFQYAVFRAPQD